ncbi:putative hydrolase [Pestalotiopsis sp. NC0098]|nr:putative hydrolase [Pestalotiopsis sp. NC0098]
MWTHASQLYVLFFTVASSTAQPFAANESDISGNSKYVDNNGVRIHYITYGSGEPLIFQHGFPDRESTWNDNQIDVFAKSYKVITPTLRGYPPSDVPSGHSNYSSQLLVSDLTAILDSESIDRAILIGHDVGGAVTKMFAYAFPERVTALVLTNTPFIPTFIPLVEFDQEQQKMSHYTLKPTQEYTDDCREHNRQDITDYLQDSPIAGMLSFYNENYPGPPYGQNVNLNGLVQSVPTCIIWGEEDRYFSVKTLDGLEKWFSDGVRLVTIPHAGHWSFRDQPRRWNAELESFLEFLRGYTFPVTLKSAHEE